MHDVAQHPEQARAAERPVAAVLGLDTVGGSLALALRRGGQVGAVAGWDPDFDVARQARRLGVADRYATTAPDVVRHAAAVFLATGRLQVPETLTAIAPHLTPGAVVCSFLETQEAAGRMAAQSLPANVSFVSGHPILAETIAPDMVPSAQLFQQGLFCVAPLPSAHPDAVAYVAHVAEALGMEPFFLDAREHDAFFGGIGRLPAVLAAALMRVVAREPSWRELGRVAGGQFRHATALVEADPAAQQAGLAADREHLVRWLGTMVDELAALRDALQDGREPADFFASALEARRKWQQERRVPAAAAELPAVREAAPRRRLWF
jgi:prephenate dehydrogenase